MNERQRPHRGLGRGLASLIPTAPPAGPAGASGIEAPEATAPETASAYADRVEAAPGGQPDGRSGGDGPAAVPGARLVEVPIGAIEPNPRQPRLVMDEDELAELVVSIREVGLLQPVVVRDLGAGRFQLVMGERRWRASQAVGLEHIPAIVRETGDEALLRDALLENLHRVQLNPLEEAAAYQQLLDDFSSTHDELAQRIGRSRSQITNTIRLLRLSGPVQRRVAAGVLSAGHARALLGVENAAAQERLAGRIVAEGLSVRTVEEIVAIGEADAGEEAPRKRTQRKPVAPGVEDLAARLSDVFETRVKVDLGARKGRITVEFASLEDLERIVGLMAPDLPESRS